MQLILSGDHLLFLHAGIQGFCKDLLEVADILEKATQRVPKEEICLLNTSDAADD